VEYLNKKKRCQFVLLVVEEVAHPWYRFLKCCYFLLLLNLVRHLPHVLSQFLIIEVENDGLVQGVDEAGLPPGFGKLAQREQVSESKDLKAFQLLEVFPDRNEIHFFQILLFLGGSMNEKPYLVLIPGGMNRFLKLPGDKDVDGHRRARVIF